MDWKDILSIIGFGDGSGGTVVADANNPVPTYDTQRIRDIFGNPVTSMRHNHMEVPFDSTSYVDFITEDSQHGGTVQANGETRFTTGANVSGYCIVTCIDATRYRSGQEAGVGFTAYFPSGAVTGVRQRVGAVLGGWDNSVWLGYDDTGANPGIYYYRGGVEQQFTSLAEINAAVGYTVDLSKDQICRILFGLFGHRGWVFELCKPSGEWVSVAGYTGVNTDAGPVFQNEFDIHVRAEVDNQGNNATDVQIASSCFAGWTTSGAKRLSDTFSDRSLVLPVQAVITGSTTAGGGGFVDVKVSPSGAAEVNANQATSPWETRVQSESLVKNTYTASASGDNIVYTPDAGKKIRLYYFDYSAGSNVTGVLVGLKLEGYNSSGVCDNQRLVADGHPFARNIQGGKRYIEGSADGRLIVNLSAAQSVYVNFELEEVD